MFLFRRTHVPQYYDGHFCKALFCVLYIRCTESLQHSKRRQGGGVSVTTVVTAPLDSQRREGGRPSAIKIQFAKGPQWIHDNQQRGRMVEFIVVP